MSTLKVPYDRVPKSGDDPLIEVVETVADTIFATCGPSFWGVLVIALLTSVFR